MIFQLKPKRKICSIIPEMVQCKAKEEEYGYYLSQLEMNSARNLH